VFKDIINNHKYYHGYSYITRVKTTAAGGKTAIEDSMVYTEVPIVFIPEKTRPQWTKEGYKHDGTTVALVPSRFFMRYEITPNVNDIILKPNGTRYRIIGFADFTDQPFIGVYELRLKREEYDGT